MGFQMLPQKGIKVPLQSGHQFSLMKADGT